MIKRNCFSIRVGPWPQFLDQLESFCVALPSPLHVTITPNLTDASTTIDLPNPDMTLSQSQAYVQLRAIANDFPALDVVHISLRIPTTNPPSQITFQCDANGTYWEINQSSAGMGMKIYRALITAFTVISDSEVLKDQISEANERGFAFQEQALKALSVETGKIAAFNLEQGKRLGEFLQKAAQDQAKVTEELTSTLQRSFSSREDELEERFRAKEVEFHSMIKRRGGELDAKEAALNSRVSEVDARAATFARRGDLKDFKDRLDQQKSVSLSKDTEKKRLVIHATFAGAFLILTAIVGAFAYRLLVERAFDGWHVAPLTTSLLMLITTAVYYIRWNDTWFREHANVEFMDRRFGTDIIRANWIAEMFFEGREKDKEIPESLLKSFCHGLFNETQLSLPKHPADQIGAQVERVQTVKFGKDGMEIIKDQR